LPIKGVKRRGGTKKEKKASPGGKANGGEGSKQKTTFKIPLEGPISNVCQIPLEAE